MNALAIKAIDIGNAFFALLLKKNRLSWAILSALPTVIISTQLCYVYGVIILQKAATIKALRLVW